MIVIAENSADKLLLVTKLIINYKIADALPATQTATASPAKPSAASASLVLRPLEIVDSSQVSQERIQQALLLPIWTYSEK